MNHLVNVYPTPLQGISHYSKTPFIITPGRNDPFSFSDLFNSQDSKTATIQSSSSTTGTNKTGTGATIATGILSVLGGLAPILPDLGLGSKSRINESKATANANISVLDAQSKLLEEQSAAESKSTNEKIKLYLIVGVGVLMIVVIAGILFARR